uniref:En/Spm-like transposon protein n=1 Tax=Arabidopsis thaliana TaxID=3702 RepID=Q9SKG9_ARATH|nr:En/Spm-like transposon protein [Arabidopsis thaliana]
MRYLISLLALRVSQSQFIISKLKKQFKRVRHIPNGVCLTMVASVLTSTYQARSHINKSKMNWSSVRLIQNQNGTYVDRKVEKIAQTYQKKVQEKLTELEAETSAVSDGTSQPRELTVDECTTIFLQSTKKDSRGTLYGVGNMKGIFLNGKHKQLRDSFSSMAM